jgi:hypothetical protein
MSLLSYALHCTYVHYNINQVVPDALLDFAFNIMRSTFSAGLQKTVYTFTFDRFMSVTPALLNKLTEARRARSVVVTTPTSVKSFMLKYAELLDKLEATRLRKAERDDDAIGTTAVTRGMRRTLGWRKASGAGVDTVQDIDDLRRQASVCTAILGVFREGALILDEVCMHNYLYSAYTTHMLLHSMY